MDNALSEALKTTDPQQKTKLHKEAQDIIWKESPWVPLVVESWSPPTARTSPVSIYQPDTGFSFRTGGPDAVIMFIFMRPLSRNGRERC